LSSINARKPLPNSRSRNNLPNKRLKPSHLQKRKLDKATIAANVERQEKQRDFIYSLISLFMKLGLLTIFAGSFVRLGIASHRRIMRNMEISSVLNQESQKLYELSSRFDRLFTIGGQTRLINEQDHLIAPNSVRVIWR
tara:strand:+ start:514 stop:930 length:417 start_codon:yes stop_codon:yes gene_type:complete